MPETPASADPQLFDTDVSPLVSWNDPRWHGFAPGVRKKHDLAGLSEEEIADLRTHADAAVSLGILRHRALLLDKIPTELPNPTDTTAWTEIGKLWRSRVPKHVEVYVRDVPAARGNGVMHTTYDCPVLLKKRPPVLRTYAGSVWAFTDMRQCVGCFALAPSDPRRLFALEVAVRSVRDLSPLFGLVDLPQYGSGRADLSTALTRMADSARILADTDPEVVDLLTAAAAATRHAYAEFATRRRTEHVTVDDLIDQLAVPFDRTVLEELSTVPATVKLSGAGWLSSTAFQMKKTGAVFDLGKSTLTWQTTAVSALYLMLLAQKRAKSRKLTISTTDDVFDLALRLGENRVGKTLESWQVAQAVHVA